jgi:sortase A
MPVVTEDDAPVEQRGARNRPLLHPLRTPDLCRNFIEQMVARGMVIAARRQPHSGVPEVDWTSIWSKGEGALSAEQAIGSIVAEAFITARDLSGGTDELFGPMVPQREVAPAQRPPPDLPSAQHRVDLSFAPAVAYEQPLAAQAPPPAPSVPSRVVVPAAPQAALPDVVAPAALPDADTPPSDAPIKGQFRAHYSLVTAFTWIRNIGAVLLLFVAWQLWGTAISQHHAQTQLNSAFNASVRAHKDTAKGSSVPALIAASAVVPSPPEGSPVARIAVPAIGLDEVVVSGTAEGDLAEGPGHYIGSAMPGQAGNVAIAGHRTTNGAPFNSLGQLAVGDPIYLTTLSGQRLTYLVAQPPFPVSPSDVSVLYDFGDNRITLTTCNPEYSSSQRLIVVGELKEPGHAKPAVTKAKPTAYHLVDPATASWNLSSLPVIILEAGALLLLALSNRLFAVWFGTSARWFILVPIWVAGFYLLFSSLVAFLPASI